jgi:hypothetical protein
MTGRSSPLRTSPVLHPITTSDPSIGPGDTVFYHEEFSLEYRIESEDSASGNSFVHFRIITRSSDADPPELEHVRFEIFNDSDLYYFIESVFDAARFEELRASGDLLVEFGDFAGEVEKLIRDSRGDKSDVTAVLYETRDGGRRLDFNQLLELRAVEIFSLDFESADREFVDRQAQYRYE